MLGSPNLHCTFSLYCTNSTHINVLSALLRCAGHCPHIAKEYRLLVYGLLTLLLLGLSWGVYQSRENVVGSNSTLMAGTRGKGTGKECASASPSYHTDLKAVHWAGNLVISEPLVAPHGNQAFSPVSCTPKPACAPPGIAVHLLMIVSLCDSLSAVIQFTVAF